MTNQNTFLNFCQERIMIKLIKGEMLAWKSISRVFQELDEIAKY